MHLSKSYISCMKTHMNLTELHPLLMYPPHQANLHHATTFDAVKRRLNI
jgi:hypothetical protein